jgi:N-acetylmuramic acid 6-phosphate etherase
MVNLHLKNSKLVERGIRILQQATGADRDTSVKALRKSAGNVSVAIVMVKKGVSKRESERRLNRAHGNVRAALASR